MAEWREQHSPHSEIKDMPPGFTPGHTIEIYTSCLNGELQEIESETESSVDPKDPAKVIYRFSSRIIHTGKPCDTHGALPGGLTIHVPVPPPPKPPAEDPHKTERQAIAAFDKRWGAATGKPPAH